MARPVVPVDPSNASPSGSEADNKKSSPLDSSNIAEQHDSTPAAAAADISELVQTDDASNKEGNETLWYFAIGAMVNPVSLRNRNINPITSRPAELLNHRINFFGSIGVAEAVPETGSSFHGVLHKVDHDTMEKLDKIERDYVKRNAIARCYNGTEISCVVYCRPHNGRVEVDEVAAEEVEAELSSPRHTAPQSRRASLDVSDLKKKTKSSPRAQRRHSSVGVRRNSLEDMDTSGIIIAPHILDESDVENGKDGGNSNEASATTDVDGLPLERYLEILVMGCEHFGVDKDYIQFLRNHDRQPRPKPEEFQSFGNPAAGVDAPTLTLEEVEACDGIDGRPLRVTSNGRVLECTLEYGSKDWNEFVEIHKQVGHVGEIYISRVAYDPKYGLPEKLEDYTREHSAYLEDLMWRYMHFTGLGDAWRACAWFEQSYKD